MAFYVANYESVIQRLGTQEAVLIKSEIWSDEIDIK